MSIKFCYGSHFFHLFSLTIDFILKNYTRVYSCAVPLTNSHSIGCSCYFSSNRCHHFHFQSKRIFKKPKITPTHFNKHLLHLPSTFWPTQFHIISLSWFVFKVIFHIHQNRIQTNQIKSNHLMILYFLFLFFLPLRSFFFLSA